MRVLQDGDTVLDPAENITQSQSSVGGKDVEMMSGKDKTSAYIHLVGHGRRVGFILNIMGSPGWILSKRITSID